MPARVGRRLRGRQGGRAAGRLPGAQRARRSAVGRDAAARVRAAGGGAARTGRGASGDRGGA
eukprot:69936-Prymnesium_polylepis.1